MGEINAEMSEIRADIGDNNHQRGKISGLVYSLDAVCRRDCCEHLTVPINN